MTWCTNHAIFCGEKPLAFTIMCIAAALPMLGIIVELGDSTSIWILSATITRKRANKYFIRLFPDGFKKKCKILRSRRLDFCVHRESCFPPLKISTYGKRFCDCGGCRQLFDIFQVQIRTRFYEQT